MKKTQISVQIHSEKKTVETLMLMSLFPSVTGHMALTSILNYLPLLPIVYFLQDLNPFLESDPFLLS